MPPRWTRFQRRLFIGGWVVVGLVLVVAIVAATQHWLPFLDWSPVTPTRPFEALTVPSSFTPGQTVLLSFRGSFRGRALWRFSADNGLTFRDLGKSENNLFHWTVPDDLITTSGRIQVANEIQPLEFYTHPTPLRIIPSVTVSGPGASAEYASVALGATVEYQLTVLGQRALDLYGAPWDLQTREDTFDATWRSEVTVYDESKLTWVVPNYYLGQFRRVRVVALGLADPEVSVLLSSALIVKTPGAVQQTTCHGRFTYISLENEYPKGVHLLAGTTAQPALLFWATGTKEIPGSLQLLYREDSDPTFRLLQDNISTRKGTLRFLLPLSSAQQLYFRLQSTVDSGEYCDVVSPVNLTRSWAFRPDATKLEWIVTNHWLVEVPLRIEGGKDAPFWSWQATLRFPDLDRTLELRGPNAIDEFGPYVDLKVIELNAAQQQYVLSLVFLSDFPADVLNGSSVELGLNVGTGIPTWTWFPVPFILRRPPRIQSGLALTSIVFWRLEDSASLTGTNVRGQTFVPGYTYILGYEGSHIGTDEHTAPVDYYLSDGGKTTVLLGFSEGTTRRVAVTLPAQAQGGTAEFRVRLRVLAAGNADIELALPIVLTSTGVRFPATFSPPRMNLLYEGLSRPLTSATVVAVNGTTTTVPLTVLATGAYFDFNVPTAGSYTFRLTQGAFSVASSPYAVTTLALVARVASSSVLTLDTTQPTVGQTLLVEPTVFLAAGTAVVPSYTTAEGVTVEGAPQLWQGRPLRLLAPLVTSTAYWTWRLPDGTLWDSAAFRSTLGLRAFWDLSTTTDSWDVTIFLEQGPGATTGSWAVEVVDAEGQRLDHLEAVALPQPRWLNATGNSGWRTALLPCTLRGRSEPVEAAAARVTWKTPQGTATALTSLTRVGSSSTNSSSSRENDERRLSRAGNQFAPRSA